MATKRFPIPLGGGVNTFVDSAALPDGQWQRLRNLAPGKPGVLGQRPSLSFVREVEPSWWHWDARTRAGSLGVASPVAGYWRWAQWIRPLRFLFDPNYGDITMVVMTIDAITVESQVGVGATTNKVVPAGTQLLITLPGVILDNGTNPVLRVGVLSEATRMPSMFVFDGITYAFSGHTNGMHIAPNADPSVPVQFAYATNNFGTANGAFAPDGACVVRDRVVYYKGPNLYFSDRNAPLTVSLAGLPAEGVRNIFLGGEELEDITAVAEISTSADGSPIQSVAAAWTASRCYLLLGEPGETTETDVIGSLQINRLNIEAGCVSQATVCRTPYGTIWAGLDDVWFMPFGALPMRVGTSIRSMLQSQPVGLRWKMHAEYADGFYRLSMFTPGQGPAIYDPCGMQMWLDLRNPIKSSAEAQWFGPQEFVQTDAPDVAGESSGPAGVWCMARDTRAAGDGRLYTLQSFIIPAPFTENIQGMSLCSMDTFEGRDNTAPQASVTLWQAEISRSEGDIMVPTPYNGVESPPMRAPILVVTTPGVSGATEPDWTAANVTGTVADGTIVWTLRYWNGSLPLNAYQPNIRQGANFIEWSMLSKEYMLDDPMAEKLLDGAELGYWSQDRTQLTYTSHPDPDSRSRVLGLDTAQIADNVLGSTTGQRVWQRKLLTPSPTKRFKGLSAAWECEQDAGIVITAGVNDSITMTINSLVRTLTIAAGFYADIAAVGLAVTAQMAPYSTGAQTTHQVDGGYNRALWGFRADFFLQVHTGSRLAQLFGYSPKQGTIIPAPAATSPTFVYGYESPRIKLAPNVQISGINLRFRLFGRRPQ